MEPRRVVITTDGSGRSIELKDGDGPKTFDVGVAVMHQMWLTTATPPDVTLDQLSAAGLSAPLAQPPAFGSLFQVCTFAPGAESPMHRTDTIDYVVVLSGEIEMDVQSGPPVRLGAGDCLVQLATGHRWANRSSTPCSMAVVCISTASDPQATGDIEMVD